MPPAGFDRGHLVWVLLELVASHRCSAPTSHIKGVAKRGADNSDQYDLPDAGEGWAVHYAFFARAGFTDAIRSPAEAHGALLVNLDRLDRDLAGEQ
jgi:hypothetical protein